MNPRCFRSAPLTFFVHLVPRTFRLYEELEKGEKAKLSDQSVSYGLNKGKPFMKSNFLRTIRWWRYLHWLEWHDHWATEHQIRQPYFLLDIKVWAELPHAAPRGAFPIEGDPAMRERCQWENWAHKVPHLLAMETRIRHGKDSYRPQERDDRQQERQSTRRRWYVLISFSFKINYIDICVFFILNQVYCTYLTM